MGEYFLISKEKTEFVLDNLNNRLTDLLGKYEKIKVTFGEYKATRSLDANALYWVWMTDLANYFNRRQRLKKKLTKDDMHDLMRHKFLGYEPAKTIGQTEIRERLKTTSKLNVNDFCEYMFKIDSWAQELNIFLSRPEDNYYSEYLEART